VDRPIRQFRRRSEEAPPARVQEHPQRPAPSGGNAASGGRGAARTISR
jgi:hypothetical protein